MNRTVPQVTVPAVAVGWAKETDLADLDWRQAAVLPPLILADGSGPAAQQTAIRLCHDGSMLFVRFECQDEDIWGTYLERDDPIYDEEVVEIFLAPGQVTPTDYYELEVSPYGVLLDVRIHNPSGQRADMVSDFAWDCPGLDWAAGRKESAAAWWAVLAIPLTSVGAAMPLPIHWRANFFRIERPHNRLPEFSCWSPPQTRPADFHKPAAFGHLILA